MKLVLVARVLDNNRSNIDKKLARPFQNKVKTKNNRKKKDKTLYMSLINATRVNACLKDFWNFYKLIK